MQLPDEKQIKVNTFVIPVIRTDLVAKCLETLYEYTSPNFYVIVVDQSKNGIDMSLREKYENLMIIRTPRTELHKTGNLGFCQGTNLGIQLTQTPYMTFLNDDVEFIHKGWWKGVMDTFDKVAEQTPERPAMIVNVASVKLPDWSVGRASGDDFYILPYQEKYTDDDWRFLIDQPHYVNEHLTLQPGSVIDGINLYCSVTDTKKLIEVGLLDELWYPGGADDYDLCCRASLHGYRCVGTTLSYVFHHWSKTFRATQEQEDVKSLVQDELRHGDLREKWGERFDLWGPSCTQEGCSERLRTTNGQTAICKNHPEEIYAIPEPLTMPL